MSDTSSSSSSVDDTKQNKALKQLVCGGVAGATAKTVTAPLSRLTILYQVHSMVTTKKHHPKFALSYQGGLRKIVERGGIWSLWRGNLTSVLHRFPYSGINFYTYERMLRLLHQSSEEDDDDVVETTSQLARRVTQSFRTNKRNDSSARHKFLAGATAGSIACIACYPLDLVRTRLTTQLEGMEHYRGMLDCFRKVVASEGLQGLYAGLGPTLFVAVPNFAISYTVYGTLKEQLLDDELFYNLRTINGEGEAKLGFVLTLACGAASGALATLVTFPMDTIRRRMQIQNLHYEEQLSAQRHVHRMITQEGIKSLYRGLTPELLKVIPMVGTMFFVYETMKERMGI